MQSPESADSLAEQTAATTDIAGVMSSQPKPYKSQRFEANGSISGTWPRPAIVMNGHEYQPFKLK